MELKHIGPYRVIRLIGRGGMGAVYECAAPETDEPCAVKVLNREFTGDGHLERFQREIETLSRFNHPNVVHITTQGQDYDRDLHFFVMEYVDGPSLAELLRRGGPLPWREVIDLGIQICRGLKNAHDQGIIHRDLKPANLLINGKIVKIADFGIAKPWGTSALTVTGAVLGSAEYMSPEQAEGETAVDRSDLYALGAVFYAMLTGDPPLRAPSLLKLLRIISTEPVVPAREVVASVPFELDQLVLELLNKKSADRPPNALNVGRRLERMKERFATEEPSSEATEPQVPRTRDRISQAPAAVAIARPDAEAPAPSLQPAGRPPSPEAESVEVARPLPRGAPAREVVGPESHAVAVRSVEPRAAVVGGWLAVAAVLACTLAGVFVASRLQYSIASIGVGGFAGALFGIFMCIAIRVRSLNVGFRRFRAEDLDVVAAQLKDEQLRKMEPIIEAERRRQDSVDPEQEPEIQPPPAADAHAQILSSQESNDTTLVQSFDDGTSSETVDAPPIPDRPVQSVLRVHRVVCSYCSHAFMSKEREGNPTCPMCRREVVQHDLDARSAVPIHDEYGPLADHSYFGQLIQIALALTAIVVGFLWGIMSQPGFIEALFVNAGVPPLWMYGVFGGALGMALVVVGILVYNVFLVLASNRPARRVPERASSQHTDEADSPETLHSRLSAVDTAPRVRRAVDSEDPVDANSPAKRRKYAEEELPPMIVTEELRGVDRIMDAGVHMLRQTLLPVLWVAGWILSRIWWGIILAGFAVMATTDTADLRLVPVVAWGLLALVATFLAANWHDAD